MKLSLKGRYIRSLALVSACAMVMTGCANNISKGEYGNGYTPSYTTERTNAPAYEPPATTTSTSAPVVPVDNSIFPEGRSTMLTLSQDDTLEISRRGRSVEQPMSSGDGWTILVYMCGTDLESDYGSASEDLEEMMDSASGSGLRFVVETDGTTEWQNSWVDGNSKQRFLIENGKIKEVYSGSSTNMGESDTLYDFISWGVKEYPAQHMGLVLWNHGGGSISGVCFDQNYDSDSLELREIETALTEVHDEMTTKFDFIGFDACLMSTVEMANILVPHAQYMYASQELESGYGWDYSSIGEYLSSDGDTADGESLGKVVCDSYMKTCSWSGEEKESTMCCIDLSKIDELIKAFNDYSLSLFDAVSEDNSKLTKVLRAIINDTESYGSNNNSEGYTNMLDLGGLTQNSAEAAGLDGSRVLSTLNSAITYNLTGDYCLGSSGLSIYYPLSVEGSYELTTLKDICVSPYYLSIVDLVVYGMNNSGSVSGYDNSDWTDGSLFWGDEDYESDYWQDSDSDSNDHNFDLGTSPLEYATMPHLSEDGMYQFTLTPESVDYLDKVYCNVLMSYYDDYGNELMLDLGTDDYVSVDWETGEVEDNFNGYWFALPDGQPLPAFLIECTDYYNVYTCPIFLNDEFTYLRIQQDYYDDYYTTTMLGTWDGVEENGSVSREVRELEIGDRICPCYDGYDISTFEYIDYYYGDDWVYQGDPDMEEALLYEGDYYYCFEIYDIFGSALYTDYVLFGVEADGSLYFYGDSSSETDHTGGQSGGQTGSNTENTELAGYWYLDIDATAEQNGGGDPAAVEAIKEALAGSDMSYYFFDDGTVSMDYTSDGEYSSAWGEWTADGSYITITEESGAVSSVEYSLSGDKLIMVTDGIELVFSKY